MKIKTLHTYTAVIALSILGACSERSTMPDMPSYQVVSDETKRDIKRSVEVVLEGPVSTDQLEAIGKKIKAKDRGKYKRTFISYTLADMQKGYGFYATTHYNPDLEVKISGLDVNQTAEVLAASKSLKGETLGLWFDDTPGIAHLIVLVKTDDDYALKRIYPGGKIGNRELSGANINQGLKLTWDNDHGDFMFFSDTGDLFGRNPSGYNYLYRKAME